MLSATAYLRSLAERKTRIKLGAALKSSTKFNWTIHEQWVLEALEPLLSDKHAA